MDRAALLCRSAVVDVEHVLLAPPPSSSPLSVRPPAAPASERLSHEIEEVERRRILQALEECGGNQTLSAKRLGISRRKLLNRLDEYGVPRPRKRQ
jgi:DNA-binding NtrC family response regulator